jgi:flavin-dependent dehydrogenase
MSQKYDYDVIIAGGGMSGLLTAAAVAYYSKQNTRVLVIDRNSDEEPGKKTINGWTCGDATSKGSLEYLRKNIGITYSYPELEHPVKGVVVFSPDHQTKVLFEGEGYILNRKLLPRKQVNDAKKLGVDFIFGVSVESLLAEDNSIKGVIGRNIKDNSIIKKTARVVIDSAGSATKLRQHLPINSKIEKEIDKDDLESTGRYIYEFEPAEEDTTWFDPDYAIIHLDQYLAPGGYCLAPDTPVICKNSLKPIQEIKLGDEVLTTMGWMPVADTSVRQYAGYLVAVTPFMLNEQIKLTPDHLVRVWNPNSGEGWKRADELVGGLEDEETLGDYLIIPLPKSSATPKIPKFLQLQEGHDGSTKDTHIDYLTDKDQFNTELKDEEGNRNARLGFSITPEFLELCGFYVSTASIRDDYVIFANLDSSMLDRLTTLIKAIGLEDSLSKKSQNKKTRRYYCIELYNGSLARILAKNFGVEQSQKKIPSWVHELETESKIAFLRGIFQNNGTIKREDRSKLVYYSSSHGLAIDMWLLLASIGVIASIDRKNEGKSYAVKVLNGVFTSDNKIVSSSTNTNSTLRIVDNRVYLKIKKIQRTWYSGPVYDLNSAGDFSAIFNVHNCWTFPKGKTKVNIGLGVQKSALDARNNLFGKKDNLQSLIDQYVAANKAIKNPKQPDSENDRGNTKGSWQVPVRRHNDCMVANGYAIVGDAAWMPRPIDAGGIGPSIYSSVILGRVVSEALEANDTSEAGLWRYNLEYMKTYGYQMASFQVLRAYLQTLSNTQIDYGMRYFLSEDDVAHITRRQHPEFDRIRFLNPVMWARIIKEYKLANGLRYTAKKSQELIEHNLNFPEKPEGWFEWKKALVRHINEAYSKLGINKIIS